MRIGRYELLEPLGTGVLGQTHLAEDTGDRRPVAVTLLHPHWRVGGGRRLAAAIEGLRDPRGRWSATLLEGGEHEGRWWYAAEYLEGRSLLTVIRDGGQLSDRVLSALAADVAEALQELHRAGRFHGDLRPSNVIINRDGARLTDPMVLPLLFRMRAQDQAQPDPVANLRGDPSYTAPSALRRPDLPQPHHDLHSLAMILLHAASGRRPQRGPDLQSNIAWAMVEQHPAPTDVDPRIRQLILDLQEIQTSWAKVRGILRPKRHQAKDVLRQHPFSDPVEAWAEIAPVSRARPVRELGPAADPPPTDPPPTEPTPPTAPVTVPSVPHESELPAPSPTRKSSPTWRFATDGMIDSAPVAAGDRVLVASLDGHVYAVAVDGGRELWRFHLGDTVRSGLAVHGDRVYVAADNGILHVLSRDGGELLASTPLDDPLLGVPAVVDGGERVAVVSADGRLVVFDRGRNPKRVHTCRGGVITGPAGGAGRYHLATSAGLEIIDRRGGKPRFAAIGDAEGCTPLATDDAVYVGTASGDVHALTPDGSTLWRSATSGAVLGRPALTSALVVVGSRDRHVHAFDRNSGERRWATPVGGEVSAGAAVEGDTVYVGCRDGYLYALSAFDGLVRWRFRTGGRINGSRPEVGDRLVYVGSADGHLYAIDRRTGEGPLPPADADVLTVP